MAEALAAQGDQNGSRGCRAVIRALEAHEASSAHRDLWQEYLRDMRAWRAVSAEMGRVGRGEDS
jgi:hypothetical protein